MPGLPSLLVRFFSVSRHKAPRGIFIFPLPPPPFTPSSLSKQFDSSRDLGNPLEYLDCCEASYNVFAGKNTELPFSLLSVYHKFPSVWASLSISITIVDSFIIIVVDAKQGIMPGA